MANNPTAGCVTILADTPIYNFQLQQNILAQNSAVCGSTDATLNWSRNVSKDYIDCCGGNQIDINFMRNMFSSTPKKINTLNYYQKYSTSQNENVTTASKGLAATAGTTDRFQLSANSHSSSGKGSALSIGMQLYNYRNGQMVTITDINKAITKSFVVTVKSTGSNNVDIKANDKFKVLPAVMVGGKSCPVADTSIRSGFTYKDLNKIRIRKEWCVDMEVDKPFNDEFQGMRWIAKDGSLQERALPTAKMNAMAEITEHMNLVLFFGAKVTNPELTSSILDWTGGEGLLTAIRGAGNDYQYNPAEGFSLQNEFENIILVEDGKKKTTEWGLFGSLRLLAGMTRRSGKDFKNEITPLDFGTIKRYGGEIEKQEVTAFKYLGKKVIFRTVDEFNKSHGIGNGEFPDLGMMIAMDGLVNSNGESIPPIQFFQSENEAGKWEQMKETDRNMETIDGCEQLKGHIIETMLWMINCPDRHYILTPTYCV